MSEESEIVGEIVTIRKWNLRDFFTKTPCVRDAVVHGILGGLGIGFAAFVATRKISKFTKYTVFGGQAVFIGSFTYCDIQLRMARGYVLKKIQAEAARKAELAEVEDATPAT